VIETQLFGKQTNREFFCINCYYPFPEPRFWKRRLTFVLSQRGPREEQLVSHLNSCCLWLALVYDNNNDKQYVWNVGIGEWNFWTAHTWGRHLVLKQLCTFITYFSNFNCPPESIKCSPCMKIMYVFLVFRLWGAYLLHCCIFNRTVLSILF
jgi:hypothetical protein